MRETGVICLKTWVTTILIHRADSWLKQPDCLNGSRQQQNGRNLPKTDGGGRFRQSQRKR
jgi:hypothetical protein